MPLDPNPPGPVHRPVLLDEVLHWVAPRPGMVVIDGTVGAGGHAAALAEKLAPTGRLIGLDRDPAMLELARLATSGLPVTLTHAAYSEIGQILRAERIDAVDAILLDLGLSSDQLAWPDRGFSFSLDGPLDMRFDPEIDESAADLVNSRSADELADIFYHLGEERYSRRIARRIVEERKSARIDSTARLAEIVRRSIPGKWGHIDPATRVFQALRIAVNDEFGHLEATLQALPRWLKPGGRAVLISFHSLEDRRVKHAFRDHPELSVLTRKPVMASPEELQRNPRARSAKLRVAERCTNPISPPSPPTPPKFNRRRRP